jgi:NAD(P)-dependent dehydrogenase (short-subunit alcohol dehydrogenase family)
MRRLLLLSQIGPQRSRASKEAAAGLGIHRVPFREVSPRVARVAPGRPARHIARGSRQRLKRALRRRQVHGLPVGVVKARIGPLRLREAGRQLNDNGRVDIAPIIEFQVTDDWWITGQTIFSNGGYTTG